MNEQQGHTAAFRVPALIKRNTALIALSQSFTGAGMQMAYGVGPLMVIALSGSASLAGVSVGLFALSRFVVAYPIGRVTDAMGRKPGIFMGLALALCGTIATGAAMTQRSLPFLMLGMLLFGMGMSAAQQLRVAAADMYPPRMRARALGYVATGSLLGLVVSPLLIATSATHAASYGLDPLAMPWFLLPGLILGGMAVVSFIRPDPKQIGQRLGDYYPGHAPVAPPRPLGAFDPNDLLRRPSTRLAIACNCAAQANMSIVMVLTSLVLDHHGHTLTEIGFSHMFHSAGMFAFTVPLGWLSDRLGRERVMYPGVLTTIVGAALVGFGHGMVAVTLGTFLVGLGWAAANVSATALIADHAPTEHRGRAIGVNDSFAGAAAVATAVITGPMIEWIGLGAAGLTAVLFAVPPLLMRLMHGKPA